MADTIVEHGFVSIPVYGLLSLCDQENAPAEDPGSAISQAMKHVAATTGYEVFISCAQDLLPVYAGVRLWDEEPSDENLTADGSSLTVGLSLHCPSAELTLGSPTGENMTIDLPSGPGQYAAVVSYRDREEAARNRATVIGNLGSGHDPATQEPAEYYVVSLWRTEAAAQEVAD